MILTLEVSEPESSAPGYERRKVFGTDGGTIGRLPDNNWVLPEPYVSGRHAIIRFMNGAFHIEDTSRNGTCLNSAEETIVRGRSYPLKSGDRIKIDPYWITVQVAEEPIPAANDRKRHDDPLPPFGQSSDAFSFDSSEPLRPAEGLGFEFENVAKSANVSPSKGQSAPALQGGPLEWDHYSPPAPIEPAPNKEIIPANWDTNSSSSIIVNPPIAPKPAPKQASRPAPNRSAVPATDSLSALLQAAGIPDASLTPELASEFGQIFRVVVSGVMDVLKARQQTKDQFGLGMTTFKPADNNPLKFSVDVEDALRQLFVPTSNSKYLGPVDAFEDAFEDMRNHQIAMLVGVRVAFETMLSEFDPDHLQEQFDRQAKKGALVSIPARLRYWDLYRDWIRDMVRDADTSFRELFGDEFARAYEEQLRRLKAQGRAQKKG